ncbi:MAG: response regulator [Lentisphaeraceae bacterium]|nr:response regulator [Lentisphaeraceae bacterium]
MSEFDVLFVDDDENILNAFKRNLNGKFKVCTVFDVTEAIGMLKKNNFPIIVSDMKMPKINGADFLSIVKKHSPNSVRILLSGESTRDDIITCINECQIFKFLSKPCPPADLEETLKDAYQHYKENMLQKDEVDITVKGVTQVIASMHKFFLPEIYNKSLKIARQSKLLAKHFNIDSTWELEMTSLLMFFGALHNKVHGWEILKIGENMDKSLNVSIGFLKKIPKFQNVTVVMNELRSLLKNKRLILNIDSEAKLIKFLIDYNSLISDSNFEKKFQDLYAKKIFDDLPNINKFIDPTFVREISPEEIASGMIFAEPVKTKAGATVVNQGEVVSERHVLQVKQFHAKNQLDQTLKLIDRGS